MIEDSSDATSQPAPKFEATYIKGYPVPMFVCPECNKAFTLKGNLKKHYLIHTGEKPFRCSVCLRAFRQKISVLTHLTACHKIPLWKSGNLLNEYLIYLASSQDLVLCIKYIYIVTSYFLSSSVSFFNTMILIKTSKNFRRALKRRSFIVAMVGEPQIENNL